MVEFIIGTDIFKEPGDLYLITVNTHGIMGTGLAKVFKDKFPELYQRYRHDCKMKMIAIGQPVIYKADDNRHYMMFPTKERWQDPSQPTYISSGLDWMVNSVGEEIDPKWKIVIPPLGCANGGLDFNIVKETISTFLDAIPNEVVVVYPPWMATDPTWD